MITIETETMSDFFTKYHVKGLPFDAVIHHFSKADDGFPHDHPFSFDTFILNGSYLEEVYIESGRIVEREWRVKGQTRFVPAHTIHKIIDISSECWTIILPRKKIKDSGFYDFRPDGTYFRFWYETEFKKLFL